MDNCTHRCVALSLLWSALFTLTTAVPLFLTTDLPASLPTPPTTTLSPSPTTVPDMLWCRSFNWVEMTCSWEGEPASIYSTYDLMNPATPDLTTQVPAATVTESSLRPNTTLFWTIHPRFGTFQCPHPVGHTGCRWTSLDGSNSFRPGMRYWMRLRTMTDSGPVWSEVFPIKTSDIVEPAPVQNVTIQTIGDNPEILAPRLVKITDGPVNVTEEDTEEEIDKEYLDFGDLLSNKEKLLANGGFKSKEVGTDGKPIEDESQHENIAHEDFEKEDNKRIRHDRKHKRGRRHRQRRSIEVAIEPPPSEHKQKYLLRWDPPTELEMLPLVYKVKITETSSSELRGPHKSKKQKGVEQKESTKEYPLVSEPEIELDSLEMDTEKQYVLTIEAKPSRQGYWSHPAKYIIQF